MLYASAIINKYLWLAADSLVAIYRCIGISFYPVHCIVWSEWNENEWLKEAKKTANNTERHQSVFACSYHLFDIWLIRFIVCQIICWIFFLLLLLVFFFCLLACFLFAHTLSICIVFCIFTERRIMCLVFGLCRTKIYSILSTIYTVFRLAFALFSPRTFLYKFFFSFFFLIKNI